MELAELEAKADDLFQNIKLSFGKDALLSFINHLSQRHLGFEYVCDANQADVVPDYSEMVPWGDTPTDVEMFYQDCSTNRDVQSLASVAGQARQAEICSTNHLHSDALTDADNFSARNDVCNECSNLAVFSPAKKRIRTRDDSVAHELIDKRANSNRAQRITAHTSDPCKPVKQLQHLYQDTIVSFLKLHWDHLTINGLFGATLRETVAFPNSTTHLPHEQQRGYHDILRALGKSDSLHALRRVVAEIRSLQCYTKFLEEVQFRCGRKRGESAKNLAHKEYICQVFPDATTESLKMHHANFKSDLQSARRWVLMIEGHKGKGGAGLGIILAASKSLISFINNKLQVTHKALLEQLQGFTNNAPAMEICQILNPVAQVLLEHHRLPEELDWKLIQQNLEHSIRDMT